MDRKLVRRFVLIALGSILALPLMGASSPVAAAPPAPTRLQVVLHTATRLAPDARTIFVNLIARCPERWTVLESSVTVSQPHASGKGAFPLTCTGQFQSFSVAVPATGAQFQLGQAQATGFVLVKRGRTEQTRVTEPVSVDPAVFVELANTARLDPGGGAVSIDVSVACPAGATGQGSSYVNASQGQAVGSSFYLPVCDGRWHTFTVRVQPRQSSYQPGAAQALTFADVEFGGNAFSGVDEGPIQIVA